MIHCRMRIFTFDGTKTHLCLCVCVNRSLCPVWTPVYMDKVYIQYTSKTGAFNIFMICSSVQPNYISCAVARQTLKTPVSNTMNLRIPTYLHTHGFVIIHCKDNKRSLVQAFAKWPGARTRGLRSNADFQPREPPLWPRSFASNRHIIIQSRVGHNSATTYVGPTPERSSLYNAC